MRQPCWKSVDWVTHSPRDWYIFKRKPPLPSPSPLLETGRQTGQNAGLSSAALPVMADAEPHCCMAALSSAAPEPAASIPQQASRRQTFKISPSHCDGKTQQFPFKTCLHHTLWSLNRPMNLPCRAPAVPGHGASVLLSESGGRAHSHAPLFKKHFLSPSSKVLQEFTGLEQALAED